MSTLREQLIDPRRVGRLIDDLRRIRKDGDYWEISHEVSEVLDQAADTLEALRDGKA